MHLTFFNQPAKDVKQFLRSADGKRRNNHGAAALRCGFNNLRQARLIIVRWMQTVSVSRFTKQIVRRVGHGGLTDDQLVVSAEVAGEKHFESLSIFPDGHFNASRTQDVAGAKKSQRKMAGKFEGF